MSDTPPDQEPLDTPELREANATAPPTEVYLPNPPGSVLAAEVADDGGPVGWVWIALATDVVPRAGIVLRKGRTPSEPFQDDLGVTTLAVRSSDVDAREWMRNLRATRGGPGALDVAEPHTFDSLGTLRRHAGHG